MSFITFSQLLELIQSDFVGSDILYPYSMAPSCGSLKEDHNAHKPVIELPQANPCLPNK